MNDYSNQVGHYFKSKGYTKGDSVALMLENRPEYVGIWLGLSKIGVITALINTNLVSDPLVHCMKMADCKALIYGSDFIKGWFLKWFWFVEFIRFVVGSSRRHSENH